MWINAFRSNGGAFSIINRNTLIWIVFLFASGIGVVGSGIWLVVSGYEADEGPSGPLILTP